MAPPGYPAKVVVYARKLHAAGWNRTEIVRILSKEHGVNPHPKTVRRWTDDRFAEQRRREQLKSGRENLKAPWKPPHRRLLQLHTAGLSHRSIALLLNLDHGLNLSTEQVRYLCTKEVPRQPTLCKLLTPTRAAA